MPRQPIEEERFTPREVLEARPMRRLTPAEVRKLCGAIKNPTIKADLATLLTSWPNGAILGPTMRALETEANRRYWGPLPFDRLVRGCLMAASKTITDLFHRGLIK